MKYINHGFIFIYLAKARESRKKRERERDQIHLVRWSELTITVVWEGNALEDLAFCTQNVSNLEVRKLNNQLLCALSHCNFTKYHDMQLLVRQVPKKDLQLYKLGSDDKFGCSQPSHRSSYLRRSHKAAILYHHRNHT